MEERGSDRWADLYYLLVNTRINNEACEARSATFFLVFQRKKSLFISDRIRG